MNRCIRAFLAAMVVLFAGSNPVFAQADAHPAPRYHLVAPDPPIFRINNPGQGIGNFVTATGVTH